MVLASAIAATGCHSGGNVAAHLRPPGRSVPVAQDGSTAAHRASSTLTVPLQGPARYAGLSLTDWESIDQALSNAQSALAQSDTDASHDEQGDTTP
jgi:hypothetical protein